MTVLTIAMQFLLVSTAVGVALAMVFEQVNSNYPEHTGEAK